MVVIQPDICVVTVERLFPDKKRTLHLFSGKVDLAVFPGDTVDINPEFRPTYIDDAQTLCGKVPLEQYCMTRVLADPPYKVEDAERYQKTMIKLNVVMRALQKVDRWTHTLCGSTKSCLCTVKALVRPRSVIEKMVKSTNHRFRVVTVFRRRDAAISHNVAAATKRREAARVKRRELEAAD